MRPRLREHQPITGRLQSIGLKSLRRLYTAYVTKVYGSYGSEVVYFVLSHYEAMRLVYWLRMELIQGHLKGWIL